MFCVRLASLYSARMRLFRSHRGLVLGVGLVLPLALYACGTHGDLEEGNLGRLDASLSDVVVRVDAARDGSLVDGRTDAAIDAPVGDASGDASIDSGVDGGADAAIDARDGSTTLPAGATVEAANQTTQTLLPAGLELATPATAPNAVGAFNGSGKGNKAFLGFAGFAGASPLTLGDIHIRARSDRGAASLYLNLQVDCDGDGTFDPSIDGIVAVDTALVPGLAFGAAFSDVTIHVTDPVFTIVGGGMAPVGPTKCGLYSHLGNVGGPLTDLPPTALLWDGSTGDNGMPKNKVMPAVMWVLGDSSNLADLAVTIEKTSFGAKTFVFTP